MSTYPGLSLVEYRDEEEGVVFIACTVIYQVKAIRLIPINKYLHIVPEWVGYDLG